jgi:hypothetical protein
MRTLVTFHSSAFNTTESKPYFINPECFGDDVAKWLIARLRSAGVKTDAEPGQEDFGWYFNFAVGEDPHTCVIGLRETDDDTDRDWIMWIERGRGLLGSIFGGRKRGIAPAAVTLIHSVLSAAPEVDRIRWHEQDDFQAGREDAGSPEP